MPDKPKNSWVLAESPRGDSAFRYGNKINSIRLYDLRFCRHKMKIQNKEYSYTPSPLRETRLRPPDSAEGAAILGPSRVPQRGLGVPLR